ncbi:MAG: hypothetical protein HWN51_01865, partial [Desulfobacterales bacterium]|nr:hypothetical protein [Desulfobacterales bacterium]
MTLEQWDNPDCDPVRDMREYIEKITKDYECWRLIPGYCLRCKELVDVRCPIHLGITLSFIALCNQCGNSTVRLIGRG